jgi:chromosome segregation ATPase
MSKKTIRLLAIIAVVCLLSVVTNIILAKKISAPNKAEQKVEALTKELAAKERQIDDLQAEVNKLNTEVAKSKRETADAQLEVAAVKNKVAERAQAEAEEKAKEATKASEKAKAAAQQAQKSANEIVALRNSILNDLKTAKNTKKKEARKNVVKRIVSNLNLLSIKDTKNKTVYDDLKDKLSAPISMSNSEKAMSHYNILINQLNAIK